jgi:hypothetical protein
MRRRFDWTVTRNQLALAVRLLALSTAAPATAEKRVALVVGNSAYRNVTPLDNPSKDAGLMADTLTRLGFTLVGGRWPRRQF